MSWSSGQIHQGIKFEVGFLDTQKKNPRGISGSYRTHEQMYEVGNKEG